MRKTFALALTLSLPLSALAQAAPAADAPKAAAPAVSVTPYGIVAFELFKNSGLFAAQDYPAYATSTKEGAFLGEARQSRVGVNAMLGSENATGATLTGKVEFDFMGPGATSWNSAPLRLRHAYVNADWAMGGGASKLFVLGGQTDALVNQLHPESVTYLANPLFQQAGNLHRRTPQLRVGYLFDAEAVAVKLEGEIGSPADAVAPVDYNSGNRAGSPDYEVRAGVTLKPVSNFGGTVGVSYHTNSRAYDGAAYNATTHSPIQKITTSLVGVDLDAALTQFVQVKGEYFTGKGIDDGFNGIASYSVTATPAGSRKAVESSGYWAQLIIKPIPVIWLLAGVGQEKVDNATYLAAVAGDTNRLKNDMVHGGLEFNFSKAWKVGLEYVQTKTESRAATAADLAATASIKASQMSLSTQLKF